MAKRKAKTNSANKIAEAALQLAARQDWNRLSLDQIARAAKISPAEFKKNVASKDNILSAIIRYIDDETAKAVGKINLKDSPRDRLFETLMARMDILQTHRRGVLNILEAARSNPGGPLRRLLPVQAEAMRKMLRLSGAVPKGPGEPIAVAGLLGIYALTLYCWSRDNSSDMSKTMAMLDRCLRRVVPIAEILFRV